MLPAADAPPAFDYAALPAADRHWLRDQKGAIELLVRNTAANVVALGRRLADVQARLRGRFVDWVRAEFDLSVATAYKWMRVADAFGDVGRINAQASALYVLADAGSRTAIAAAVEMSAAGRRVTAAVARALVGRPAADPPAAKAYAKARAAEASRERAAADQTDDPAALWAALASLADSDADRLTITRVTDADNDADDDVRGSAAPWIVTVVRADGSTAVGTSRESLGIAVLKAAGREPVRRCANPACRRVGGLFTMFGFKENSTSKRCKQCKVCERERVKRGKAAMEARRETARDEATGGTATGGRGPSRRRRRGA